MVVWPMALELLGRLLFLSEPWFSVKLGTYGRVRGAKARLWGSGGHDSPSASSQILSRLWRLLEPPSEGRRRRATKGVLDPRRDGETDTVTPLGSTVGLMLARVRCCPPRLGEEEFGDLPDGCAESQGLATWKGCGARVSTWLLTWLWGGGSEVSRASSCWSLACAERNSCWSSKNSEYWSWNTAA